MADLPEGTGWAGLLAGITGGILWLRKYLSESSVAQAINLAQTDLVTMLREQITLERARADAAEHARDEAIGQIGELKAQVAQLTAQVQGLKTQLAGVAQSVSKP